MNTNERAHTHEPSSDTSAHPSLRTEDRRGNLSCISCLMASTSSCVGDFLVNLACTKRLSPAHPAAPLTRETSIALIYSDAYAGAATPSNTKRQEVLPAPEKGPMNRNVGWIIREKDRWDSWDLDEGRRPSPFEAGYSFLSVKGLATGLDQSKVLINPW